MKFGKTLTNALYEPWREHYIDYSKLKRLLRENRSGITSNEAWTDDDETHFVEELLNVQLEKVRNFQMEKYQEIKTQTSECEDRLRILNLDLTQSNGQSSSQLETDHDRETGLREILSRLDHVSSEINQLERFNRINFTGFRKIIKKHDKRRGNAYKLRALLSSRLAELPLNTEDYSPLLYRLSAMYSFIRHHYQDEEIGQLATIAPATDDEEYDAVTYFIHPEDLLEVKTSILRHLPVLIYDQSSNAGVETQLGDPLLTSIYFDNRQFSLYSQRLERQAGASSLRLRCFGQLSDRPDVTFELKTLAGQGASREQRIKMKKKYILPFLSGDYDLQKQISKLKAQGGEFENEGLHLESKAKNMQNFIADNELAPLLSASYKRIAFQVPGNDGIRISIDTHLSFSKVTNFTDFLNARPSSINHPSIDVSVPEEVFHSNGDESADISEFPWAVLTIKLRGDSRKKDRDWVHDLASSHLLREAPRFSKFVHGVAVLYEDLVAELPFWMSLIDTDIRRDPQSAFEDEQHREEELLEEAQAVGSYGGTPRRKSSMNPQLMQLRQPEPSPQDVSRPLRNLSSIAVSKADYKSAPSTGIGRLTIGDEACGNWLAGVSTVLFSKPITKYARQRKERQELPPGIEEPRSWLKDVGPVKVEPKVWLANQRTFIKWQHISVLLASLSLALYNSAGKYNATARTFAVVYTIVAVVTAAWGWTMYEMRSRVIRERSGEDLDNPVGPIAVCFGLGIALGMNLGLHL